MKIIKRYPNRKLYDTEESRYVNLDELARLVREGVELKVVDARTGEDLTSVVLSQILFEEERRTRKTPPEVLRSWIRSGGEGLAQLLERLLEDTVFKNLREELEGRLQRLLERGAITREEANRLIKDLLRFGSREVEEIQKRVDERITEFLGRLAPYLRLSESLTELSQRLVLLERRLNLLEERVRYLEEQRREEPLPHS